MPFAAAQSTALLYQLPPASVNEEAAALGLPSMRHRTVTSMPRVIVSSGSKVLAEVPENSALLNA